MTAAAQVEKKITGPKLSVDLVDPKITDVTFLQCTAVNMWGHWMETIADLICCHTHMHVQAVLNFVGQT